MIFDNSPHVARIDRSLTVGHKGNQLLRQRGESAGFEDVTFHEGTKRFLVIIEALPFRDAYRPLIEEYDEDFRFIEYNWVDFRLPGENKGLEGLCYVRRVVEDDVEGLAPRADAARLEPVVRRAAKELVELVFLHEPKHRRIQLLTHPHEPLAD